MNISLGVINSIFTNVKLTGLTKAKINNVKSKYWLGKNFAKLKEVYTRIESQNNELIQKYGEVAEDGSISIPYQIDGVSNPKIQEFIRERNELFALTEEVEIVKFNIDDIDASVDVTSDDLMLIDFMLNIE